MAVQGSVSRGIRHHGRGLPTGAHGVPSARVRHGFCPRYGSDAQKQVPAIAAGDLDYKVSGLLNQRRAPIPPASKPLLEEMATIM